MGFSIGRIHFPAPLMLKLIRKGREHNRNRMQTFYKQKHATNEEFRCLDHHTIFLQTYYNPTARPLLLFISRSISRRDPRHLHFCHSSPLLDMRYPSLLVSFYIKFPSSSNSDNIFSLGLFYYCAI